jgi:hypothetical protein
MSPPKRPRKRYFKDWGASAKFLILPTMQRPLVFLFAPLATIGACNSDSFDNDAGADSGSDGLIVGGGDSSTDAPVDAPVEAAPKRFCESVDARFCADFDIPNDAGAGFFPPTTTNGYTLTFQNGQFKSAPVGVEAFIPADASGIADLQTIVTAGDAGPQASITLDLDMYVPNFSTPTTQPLFLFTFGVVAPQFQFGLAHDGPVWKLEYVPTKQGSALSSAFAANEWLHVTLVVVPSATAGYASLTITSSAGTSTASTPSGTFAAAPPNSTGPYPILVDIGPNTSAPPLVTAQAYYDNVVVRVQ